MIHTSPKLNARYEVLRELGRGGMGIVFLARQKSLSREVAIKVIPPAAFNNPDTRARFAREIQVMSILNHENLVGIIECDTLEDGSAYIVMEFLDGESIEDVRLQGPTHWRKVCQWGQQMAAGLAHAHSKGIVHRDIKPANVMLLPGDKIKVMDFGIAKAEGAQNLTMDKIVGTPVYMSPEQASGKPVDLRTDIYSLGTLFYALLVGQAPFDDPRANPMEVIMKQISLTPPLVSSKAPDVPERFVELIQRMLSKSPDERPQDLNEVLEELKIIETKVESGFSRTFADIADSMRFLPRLFSGKAKASDYVFMEILLPGLSFIGRKEFGLGFILLTLGVALFFSPAYPLTLSALLRLLTGMWTYSRAKGSDLKPSLEFLWHHRQLPIVAGVILAFSMLFALFVRDTQAYEAEVELRTRKPKVVEATPTLTPEPTRTPRPTPTPEPEETGTPLPSPTPVEIAAATAAPTPTPDAGPTPTPTPRPTPIPTPVSATPRDLNLGGILSTIASPTPVAVEAARTPVPTPSAADVISTPERFRDFGMKAMAKDDPFDELDWLLTAARDLGDNPEPRFIAARMYFTYFFSQKDRTRYEGGLRRGWRAWGKDNDVLKTVLPTASPEAIDFILDLTLNQPFITTTSFSRTSTYSRYYTTPNSKRILMAAFTSDSWDRRIAALFAIKELTDHEFGPQVARMLAYPVENRASYEMVRDSALSWLERNGTRDAIPELRQILADDRIPGFDRKRVETLVAELEKK